MKPGDIIIRQAGSEPRPHDIHLVINVDDGCVSTLTADGRFSEVGTISYCYRYYEVVEDAR